MGQVTHVPQQKQPVYHNYKKKILKNFLAIKTGWVSFSLLPSERATAMWPSKTDGDKGLWELTLGVKVCRKGLDRSWNLNSPWGGRQEKLVF